MKISWGKWTAVNLHIGDGGEREIEGRDGRLSQCTLSTMYTESVECQY